MFVNIRSRAEVVHRVRAGITVDMEPMRVGADMVQPTYIEVTYRFDPLTFQREYEVTVIASAMRRNGTVGMCHLPITWPQGHPDMPEWAARFSREHTPDPMELLS